MDIGPINRKDRWIARYNTEARSELHDTVPDVDFYTRDDVSFSIHSPRPGLLHHVFQQSTLGYPALAVTT